MAYLFDKPFAEEKRSGLVLMLVLFADILFRILVEGFFAAE
jgi:hypothetical protein